MSNPNQGFTMENWFETNETQEAVLSLQMMSEQLDHLAKTGNKHYWTWIIIGLHTALNGFMVLALRGTNDLNVLPEKCAKQWLTAYDSNSGKYPEKRLDSFLNLYNKIKSEKMNLYTNSKLFIPKATQDSSVEKLNSLRNDFIHFIPKDWFIEPSYFIQIIYDCLDIISFLAFDCGNVIWIEEDLETQTKMHIENARQCLNIVKSHCVNKGNENSKKDIS